MVVPPVDVKPPPEVTPAPPMVPPDAPPEGLPNDPPEPMTDAAPPDAFGAAPGDAPPKLDIAPAPGMGKPPKPPAPSAPGSLPELQPQSDANTAIAVTGRRENTMLSVLAKRVPLQRFVE
jgi:hypothetical protein